MSLLSRGIHLFIYLVIIIIIIIIIIFIFHLIWSHFNSRVVDESEE